MPRIVIVLPRGRRFGPNGATAIDLCVRDFVQFSRYRDTTTIIGEPIDKPFEGFDFRPVPRPVGDAQWLYAQKLADAATALRPDVVVVQQHMPSGVRIAKRLRGTPIIMHRHNAPKRRKNALGRWRDQHDYARFARTLWVSDFCRDQLAAAYPAFAARALTLHNGLDFSAWTPQAQRENVVLFVGRLTREKGCAEAAEACAHTLADQPDWRARFVLSRREANDELLATVQQHLAPLGERAEIIFDMRHDEVQAQFSRAALALAPSLYEEPFGRTAIEAFAGGAALITSMRGGLREIAEGFAEPCAPPNADTIAAAITRLVTDPAHRQQLAQSGHARGVAQFDIRRVAAELDAAYDAVLRERGAAP